MNYNEQHDTWTVTVNEDGSKTYWVYMLNQSLEISKGCVMQLTISKKFGIVIRKKH